MRAAIIALLAFPVLVGAALAAGALCVVVAVFAVMELVAACRHPWRGDTAYRA